jgi:uncharacterized protein YukE
MKRTLKIVLACLPLVLVLTVLWQRQAIADYIRLYNYTPPAAIVTLADETTMNSRMRRMFYVNHPDIAHKADFKKYCSTGEKTIVLGCFIENKGIYLLSVDDERLEGIEQVTAAHETLHAAYARLSSSERKKVDAMTAAAFASLTDQRVKDTIELYRKQDPTVVPNELHSILGTEVSNLPANLEMYYTRYFSDRAKIVRYSEQYEQAFTDRKNQIADYDAQLASMKQQIDSLEKSLTAQDADLTSQRANLNDLKNGGQSEAYNAAIPGYNAKVVQYNKDVNTLTSLIAQYNEAVPKRNDIATEESELVQAIDTRGIPQQQ